MNPRHADGATASRLPPDVEYWDALRRHIVDGSRADLRRYRSRAPWWVVLGDLSPVFAAAAMLAVLALLPAMPEGRPSKDRDAATIVGSALQPRDPLARHFATDAPPSIGILVGSAMEDD